MFGMPFDDLAELVLRQGAGTLADGKSLATAKMIEEGRGLSGAPREHKSWCRVGHPMGHRVPVDRTRRIYTGPRLTLATGERYYE